MLVGPVLKSQPGDRYNSRTEIFLIFLGNAMKIPGHIQISHDRFLPHLSKFIH